MVAVGLWCMVPPQPTSEYRYSLVVLTLVEPLREEVSNDTSSDDLTVEDGGDGVEDREEHDEADQDEEEEDESDHLRFPFRVEFC